MNSNPVAQIDAIFSSEYDGVEPPDPSDESYLGVPPGTMAKLFAQVDKQDLWPALFELSEQYESYWTSLLFALLPHEARYVKAHVGAMKVARTIDDQVTFAQEADSWCWAESNAHLLPVAIELVESIKHTRSQDLVYKSSIANLELVESNLRQLFNEHGTGIPITDARRQALINLSHSKLVEIYYQRHASRK